MWRYWYSCLFKFVCGFNVRVRNQISDRSGRSAAEHQPKRGRNCCVPNSSPVGGGNAPFRWLSNAEEYAAEDEEHESAKVCVASSKVESCDFKTQIGFFCPVEEEGEEDQQLMEVKEEVPDLWRSSLEQQDPGLPHIKKEEEEELWISQGKEQLTVKSEDEENSPLFQLHQIKTEGNREAEPPTSSSADQINTEPDGEDCGGPGKNPDKASDSSETEVSEDEDDDWDENVSSSGSESEDSDGDWRETRTLRAGVKRNTRHETSKKSFSCPKCFKKFVNKTSFQKHMNSHSGESSSSLADKKRDVDLRTGVKAEKRRPTCHLCGKTLKSPYYLKVHMRFHTEEKPYNCVECGKAFYQKHQLKYHMTHHTGERPFACDKCSKTFSQLHNFKLHMTQHTGERPFHCEVCDKKFSLQGNLKLHMTIHTKEKPFVCSSCSRCFRLHSDLKAHMMCHAGVKPFICGECGARFPRLGSLNRHEKIHTGERLFACGECERTFFRKSHLQKHSLIHSRDQKVDPRNRPFACGDCAKRFLLKKHLVAHKVVHTGERSFSCSICSVSFSRAGTLKRHNTRCHNK